ncbi:hypothetical protein [Desulfonatronospira sp. MSAO_Bac3]|uniref:hypothetical protein n=1 Tax=Desulfonatronospira sp. MSAO_Bac3 TaxID=2293857 RepID=UPI00257E5CE5|nr:hypothetical protein [Desulfonatronospira sp. MSAO_Bac3]
MLPAHIAPVGCSLQKSPTRLSVENKNINKNSDGYHRIGGSGKEKLLKDFLFGVAGIG